MRLARPRLVTAANLITLGRLPLVGTFVALVYQRSIIWATITFGIAWALDAVDGALARRWQQETVFGFVADKVVDRLLIIGALVALVLREYLPPLAFLLLTREVLTLPAVLRQLRSGQTVASLGWWGKATTLLQGVAILWALLGWPGSLVIIVVVAVFGVIAAVVYSYRVFSNSPRLDRAEQHQST